MVSMRKRPIFETKPPSPPPVETIPCVNCGYGMTFAELDSHPDQCEGRVSECEYCHTSYPNMLLDEHHNVCEVRRNQIRNQRRVQSMEEGEAHFMEPRREGGSGLENLLLAMHRMRMEQGESPDRRANSLEMLIRLFMRA